MPIMDSYSSSQAIRKFYHIHKIDQPIIIGITGHTEDVYIQKAFASSMDEIIPKPANTQIIK